MISSSSHGSGPESDYDQTATKPEVILFGLPKIARISGSTLLCLARHCTVILWMCSNDCVEVITRRSCKRASFLHIPPRTRDLRHASARTQSTLIRVTSGGISCKVVCVYAEDEGN